MEDKAWQPSVPPVQEEVKAVREVAEEDGPGVSDAGRQLAARIATVLDRCKALQDTATAYSSRLKTEGDSLGEQAISLSAEVKSLRADVNHALEKDDMTSDLAEQLEESLLRARSMVYEGDVAALLPHKANGLFLRLLLGNVNVKSARRDVRFKVKEEYNSYRDRTAMLFLVFPAILLFLKERYWSGCFPAVPIQIYQGWLLFFYCSLALRENILRINGSDIRPWWIQHHYFAMLTALISLTWGIEGPDCERKQQGVRLFLAWAIMQGAAMLLQNHYQRQRLYTRIALGKAGRMDVVWGEAAGVTGQLWLLYPVLFILQAFQSCLGLMLLKTAVYEASEWQIAVCGILLLVMAVGNFVNTVATVVTKSKVKAKMRKRGRKMLQQMSMSSKKD
eukprot:SM000282S10602  [mRNA]  locus=s282:30324:33227:+ [translate_table: standard]